MNRRSFNGATLLTAWKYDGTILRGRAPAELQRSHAFDGVEI